MPRPARARRSLAFRAVVLVPVATVALVVWPLSCRAPMEVDALASEPEPEPPANAVVFAVNLGIAPAPPLPGELRTSCREVAHVGDSTSIGLVSNRLLPKSSDQIGARYHAVGVERFFPEISGARSMVEVYKDQPNATEVVKRRRTAGYRGCYVMALGTNDPANTAGNVEVLGGRIDAMMAQVGDAHVLWTTTKTLKEKGPYKNANMTGWNEALTQACARHATMRIYDWASEVRDDWFAVDGIHFNGVGYRERAQRIAKALARAFPKGESPSAACVVHATE